MRYRAVTYILITTASVLSFLAKAQEAQPFTCFNAQEIVFPLDKNDFTKHRVLRGEESLNALYYLYQDKYSFWYKFVVTEDMRIEFSVSPSNPTDRYHTVAFRYGGKDFCDKLVNNEIPPLELPREPIITAESVIYKNVLQAAKGDTIYLSVLSLNDDDCGHFLYVEAREENLSFHAIHRPCYDFIYLDAPDFSTSKMSATDVQMELTLDVSSDSSSVEKGGFAAITSIEVQSKDEALVSVGDKLILNRVFFYNNTYALKPGAEDELNQLYTFLAFNPEVHIEIQGHTANDAALIKPDPQFKGQGEAWNFKGSAMELSEMRALAVYQFLVDKGISAGRLSYRGYGDTQKRVPNAKTFEDSEKNMRVEALVTKQ